MVKVSPLSVHPSSIVEDGAQLADGVTVGPFCHVGPQVKLGANVKLLGHASIQGDTTIGAESRVFPFASVGNEPQDLKYAGEAVRLVVGARCTIREGVTLNPGTGADRGETRIGDDCVFLANSHVAHDCTLGNGIILSNNVMIAGHCTVGDRTIFGGGSAIHQFCRVGKHAFIGGLAGVEGDVIPYGMALGNRAKLAGLNIVGMKRSGIERSTIHAMRGAYKAIFQSGKPVHEAVNTLAVAETDPLVAEMLAFIGQAKDRALCTPA